MNSGSEPIAAAVIAIVQALRSKLDPKARQAIAAELLASCNDAHRQKPMTIGRLCRLYNAHAEEYYRRIDGGRTEEARSNRHAMRPLKRLFAQLPVEEFGPLRLKEVQQEMVRRGWCRKHVNDQIGRIKRMLKWAVSEELIPVSIHEAAQTVSGLRAGRTAARESNPVKPVPMSLIETVLPVVSSQVRAVIELQLATGMRPGEVVIMRTCDIDTTQEPWLYRPSHHKTEHHQHERLVFLGPRAQDIVRPFLDSQQPHEYLFSPTDADLERRRKLHALRKTPMSCGNVPGSNRKNSPDRKPGERYHTASYARAIRRALEAAFPTPPKLDAKERDQWRREHHWHPHQLRHNAATHLRTQFGIDVAQVVLGHKTLNVTQVYAEKNIESARRAMLRVG